MLESVLPEFRARVSLQLTVSQSVCLGVEPHLRLMTRYLFIFVKVADLSMWGALSDERSGQSPVSQSLEVGQLSVYTYTFVNKIFTTYQNRDTIFTRPLSVQAQYSTLCPTASSFRYNGSLVT
jgi:hypothetical protein